MLLSSDTPELVHLCDRVLVFRDGRVVATLERRGLSEEAIVAAAIGVPAEPRVPRGGAVTGGGAPLARLQLAAQRRAARASISLLAPLLVRLRLPVPGPAHRSAASPSFTQSWFPAGAGRHGADDRHADRRHRPRDRRHGQPRRGDRGHLLGDGRAARRLGSLAVAAGAGAAIGADRPARSSALARCPAIIVTLAGSFIVGGAAAAHHAAARRLRARLALRRSGRRHTRPRSFCSS